MPSPRPIVAALDFSTGAEAALVRAATLAARMGAGLHLVHASAEAPDAATDRDLHRRLERYVAEALGATPAASAPVLAFPHGPTVPAAILGYAASLGAGLLVVGTHGRSGLDRLLMGSVSEACVAASPCPVLTVPPGSESHEPSPTAPVLVAIDFSDLSRAALAAGRDLAALFGAKLELVHVVRDAGPFTGLVPSALDLGTVDAIRDAAARQRVERFAGYASPGPDRTSTHIALGSASRMIAAVAAARSASVVVMGTHGRPGVAQAILGSTTGATLQRASCAVLTVRSALASTPRPKRAARRAAAA